MSKGKRRQDREDKKRERTGEFLEQNKGLSKYQLKKMARRAEERPWSKEEHRERF